MLGLGDGVLLEHFLFALQFTSGKRQILLFDLKQRLGIGLLHIDLSQLHPDCLKSGLCLSDGQFKITRINFQQHLPLVDQCTPLETWMQRGYLTAHLGDAAPHPARCDITRCHQPGNNRDFRHADHPHGRRLLCNSQAYRFCTVPYQQ